MPGLRVPTGDSARCNITDMLGGDTEPTEEGTHMTEPTYWKRETVISRRGMLRGSAVGAMGLAGAALIGCSSGGGNAGGGAAGTAISGTPTAIASNQQAKKGGTLRIADSAVAGPVIVALRPEAVSLHRDHPEGSARNVWEATISGLEARGDLVRVETEGPPTVNAVVTPAAVSDLGLHEGARVWLSAKATELDVYPA